MVVVKVARGNTTLDQARDYYLQDKEDVAVLERDQDDTAIERASGYALHDKDGKRSSHRVGFTETINLDARDPAEAVREMRARYDAFKANEHSKRGRKLEKPIYAYSISWAPNEQPSKDEMLAAARSSLKAMRLEGLQTLIVQHLDEPQPHIHLIVSRIEADGRRARNIPWDHLRFSRWAEQYEREHGGIQCEQRVRNNEKRARRESVRKKGSPTRAQIELRERAAAAQARLQRFNETIEPLHPAHSIPFVRQVRQLYFLEQDDLKAKANFKIRTRQAQVKQRLKPMWARLFRRQGRTVRELAVANAGGPLDRAVFVYRHLPTLQRCGKISKTELARLCLFGTRLARRVREAHRLERDEMVLFQRSCLKKAKAMVQDEYRIDLREMQARQQLEHDLRMARLINERAPAAPPPIRDAPVVSTGDDIVRAMLNYRMRNPGRDFGREL